jgi:hypothetical protein
MTLAVALADAGDFRAALQVELEGIRVQEKARAQDPQRAHAIRDLSNSYGRIR